MISIFFRLTRIRTMALFYLFIVIFLATLTGLGTHLQPYFDADTPIFIAVSKYHYIMIICCFLHAVMISLDYFLLFFQLSIVHLYINALSVIFFLYLFVILHKVHKCDVMLPANSMFNKTDHPVPVLLHSAPPVSRYQRSAFASKCFTLNTRTSLNTLGIIPLLPICKFSFKQLPSFHWWYSVDTRANF